MADFSVVMDKLQGFETADDIAEYFHDYGVLGQPKSARSCAISEFVKAETGLPIIVTNRESITGYSNDSFVGMIEATAAITAFVRNYDRGDYPFLSK